MTANNMEYPKVLDPVYGPCLRKDEANRRRKSRRNAIEHNKARRAHIAECWTCYLFGHSQCDPRHCQHEKE